MSLCLEKKDWACLNSGHKHRDTFAHCVSIKLRENWDPQETVQLLSLEQYRNILDNCSEDWNHGATSGLEKIFSILHYEMLFHFVIVKESKLAKYLTLVDLLIGYLPIFRAYISTQLLCAFRNEISTSSLEQHIQKIFQFWANKLPTFEQL